MARFSVYFYFSFPLAVYENNQQKFIGESPQSPVTPGRGPYRGPSSRADMGAFDLVLKNFHITFEDDFFPVSQLIINETPMSGCLMKDP